MTTPGTNPPTAAELLKRLAQDPDHAERVRAAEERHQASVAEHRLAAAPVVAELRRAGFDVESIDELRRGGRPYAPAVDVLLKWLPLVRNAGVQESIVRALSVPWARPAAARPLVEAFRAAPPAGVEGFKWAIGSALEVVADDAVFTDIAELARDRRHGKAREMLAVALGNMKTPAAAEVLIELLSDEEVAGHAIVGLGRLKPLRARPFIERMLEHPKTWVRKEARKALARPGWR